MFAHMTNPAVSWGRSLVWLGLLLAAAGCAEDTTGDPTGAVCQGGKCDVWGTDDRHEPYDLPQDFVSKFAPSVGAFVPHGSLVDQGDSVALAQPLTSLQQSYSMCSDEAFASEPTFAHCSGFYAGGDVFVTAGHCLKLYDPSQDADRACADISIVFNAGYSSPDGAGFGTFPKDAVYGCAEVLYIDFDANVETFGNDIAVLRLDRPVTGRAPLAMRTSGAIPVGTEVYMAGYPTGLPLKISTGGHVLPGIASGQTPELIAQWGLDGPTPNFFFDLEMLGGNSGGPIFNAETNEVEGVAAVYSGQNFNWSHDANGQWCLRWAVCGQDGVQCPVNPGAFPVTNYASMIAAYVAESTVDGGVDTDGGEASDAGVP